MSDVTAHAFDPATADCLEAVSACMFCDSPRHEPAFEHVEDYFFDQVSGAFDFVRCADCASLWQPLRLDPSHIGQAYRRYYTHAPRLDRFPQIMGRLRRSDAIVRREARAGPFDTMAAAIYRWLKPDHAKQRAEFRFVPLRPSRILDYGCGSGYFLRRLQPLGHMLTGVEIDPISVEAVRAAGIECYLPHDAVAQEWAERFDAITLNHVVEHVFDPQELVRQLARWLRPGGMIYVEAPNAAAQGLEIFGRYWRGLESPRHLSIPSPVGLETVLEKAGLTVERRCLRDEVREGLWAASLWAVPEDEREAVSERIASARPETLADAEFITVVARKPSV